MTDMVTRVAEAIGEQLKLEDGGYGFVSPAMDEDGEVTDRMVVDATVRLRELARAAIEAMREPTKAMMDAIGQTALQARIWQSMLDAALKENEEKA